MNKVYKSNIDLYEISCDLNHVLHKIGDTEYPIIRRAIVSNPDEYEELTKTPSYTENEYKNKVEELIRLRYSISDELAILRQLSIKPDLFEEYNSFAELCKVKAKEILSNG